jgi:hypothetical protein
VRDGLIRLGPSQLFVLCGGLLTVFCIVWILVAPDLEDQYALEYALPRMEAGWGFRFGSIHVQRDGEVYERSGIVSLTPGGRLSRLGFRVHDAPFSYHGYSGSLFYAVLRASERGEAISIDVVNLDDWAAGRARETRRTIQVR